MLTAQLLTLGLTLTSAPGFYDNVTNVSELFRTITGDPEILEAYDPALLSWIDFCALPSFRDEHPDQCDGETRVQHVDLQVDLSSGLVRAVVLLEARGVAQAQLDLVTSSSVSVQLMGPPLSGLMSTHDGSKLTIEAMGVFRQFAVEYTLPRVPKTTLTWPNMCGTLFPCVSDPSDGITWDLEVTGQVDGEASVYAASLDHQAPPYMLAWATGPWAQGANKLATRTTPRGTDVEVWHQPGRASTAQAGTQYLPDVVAFFEAELGPYPFGSSMGSIEIPGLPFNGIEHHPFSHIRSTALTDTSLHAHEAAHGWFGNGVRIACWEDFALSEGVVTYLTAVALEQTQGVAAACTEWADYRSALGSGLALHRTSAADPTCNAIDPDTLGYQSYVKTAHFFLAVEQALDALGLDGRAEILGVLSRFFIAHRGQAAGMWDLLAALQADTGYDPTPLVTTWLLNNRAPPVSDVPRLSGCP